jgi:hypothetical protein
MMNKLLKRLPVIILFPVLLYSCIDSGYNLDDLDDSGSFAPALVLPVGTLKTSIMDLITEAGIPKNLLEISDNTIYIVYKDSMSLEPEPPVPDFSNEGVIYSIPEGIKFTLAHGEESIDIDVFETLASSGSVFYPADPQIRLDIKNYIGANIDIDVNGITSYSSDGRHSNATFGNDANSYKIHVEGAPAPNRYTAHSETFDKDKGSLHKLFAIAPNRLSYDFSVDLTVPDDGEQHFIVNGKYVDLAYELRLPMTFDAGTQLASADTIDFDLSGDDFVSNLDGLTLWIDYENGIPATAGLDILFLDEYQQAVPGIDQRSFHIKAPQTNSNASTGTLTFNFKSSELDAAKKVRYTVLKTVLKVSEVSLRPADYINLKLSAYSKINI